jgi:hypothetical protein
LSDKQFMNQRREPRFPTDRTVAVTVFGTPDTHLQGRIRNAAGRGLGLELATALATGTALKIELEDSILLGEVIYCRKQEGGWYAGVELVHALYGLVELAAIMRGYTVEPSPAEQPDAVQYAHRQND